MTVSLIVQVPEHKKQEVAELLRYAGAKVLVLYGSELEIEETGKVVQ